MISKIKDYLFFSYYLLRLKILRFKLKYAFFKFNIKYKLKVLKNKYNLRGF